MKTVLTCFLLFLCLAQSPGQDKATPILERKITIAINDEKLPSALNRIGQLGKFSFSYNTALIQADQVITLEVREKSVREILNEIFKGSLRYKEKGNHIILTKAPVAKTSPNTTVLIISGYVEDNESGARVADASVYEKSTLTSSVTNEFGYYKIKLDRKEEPVSLSVSKKNYKD